jgi:putative transposase
MKRLWGWKLSDVGYAEFLAILQWVTAKTGTQVVQIDRWKPTSQVCARCGVRQSIPLSERHFQCPDCGWSVPRDQNAALNIIAAGASTAELGDVRRQIVVAISA